MKQLVPTEVVERKILLIRGQKVVLDVELAELYSVTTKAFNQAVKRNIDRFPKDFMFQLTSDEALTIRSQFVTASGASRGKHAENQRSPRGLGYPGIGVFLICLPPLDFALWMRNRGFILLKFMVVFFNKNVGN